ncbi:DUF4249 domain-containing protein [Pontibacter saemangeumensis]|uniref:DUF4249 domain-containing protein n=1 Tax=Pontibacter saemangeumensis TaxID=1084525 RepID=UPI003CD0C057
MFKLKITYPYKPEGEVAAVVGNTYQLHLQVGDKTYESRKVKMLQPVPIDSLYTAFAEVEVGLWGKREKKLMPGYRFILDYTDPAGQKNYYRWSVASVIEVFTQPEDYVDYSCRGCPRPAPKDCCAHCWIYERSELYDVESDRLTDGRKNINHELRFVPFERDLQAKHKMTVYQHVISEEAYNFFQVVEQQRQTTGTVFDPPPSQLKGNVYNVENPDEQVIGYFDASAVSMKQIVIARENITEANVGEYVYPDDCRTIRNATTRLPENW